MTGRAEVYIDGLVYVVKTGVDRTGQPIGVRRVPLTTDALPAPVPQSGTPKTENLLSVRQLEFRTPWGVGLNRGNDPHRVADEENVMSLFQFLTLAPLKNTPTMASPPATFKIAVPGFAEGLNTIFMFGNGAAVDDEPVWYWVGSTTTWTNATVNADIGADVKDITGMAQISGTMYAIARNRFSIGGFDRRLVQATAVTTWAVTHTDANNETFAGELESHGLLAMTGGKLRSLHYNPNTSIQEQDTTPGAGNTWAAWGTALLNASSAPRGYVLWHDYQSTEATFFSTRIGLYKGATAVGAAPTLLWQFLKPRGTYTGTLKVGPDDKLYFADGPNVGRVSGWTTGGQAIIDYIGPSSMSSSAIAWDGLPLARQGDVTTLAPSKLQPWLYVGLGGLAAAKNASVMIFDTSAPIERAWHGPYVNSTAQRAIPAAIESNEDDDIPRLHIAEEQAAGGTQSPRHFNYITDNPKTQTAYTYVSTGKVRLSRMDAGLAIIKKGFYKSLLVGDDINATEKITVKFAKNGGALSTGQDITASPGGRWAGVVGTHTGAGNAAVLTDGSASFIAGGVTIGDFVYNLTDGSNGKITVVTATTVTATLTGGTDNDWDASDVYIIPKGLEGYDIDVEVTLTRGA